jgi:hypothetical protein
MSAMARAQTWFFRHKHFPGKSSFAADCGCGLARALPSQVRRKAYCARILAFVTGLSFYCHSCADKQGARLSVRSWS